MTRQILFCRHAKAELGYPELLDHDRRLTDTGIEESMHVSRLLLGQNIKPDFYISSSATRALDTCEIIKADPSKKNILISRSIYTDSLKGIESSIRSVSDKYKMIAVFGHNPSLSEIYNSISNRAYIDLPISGVFLAEVNSSSWSSFNFPEMTLKTFLYPEDIK